MRVSEFTCLQFLGYFVNFLKGVTPLYVAKFSNQQNTHSTVKITSLLVDSTGGRLSILGHGRKCLISTTFIKKEMVQLYQTKRFYTLPK